MNKLKKFFGISTIAIAIFVVQSCSFSTANLSSLETFKDEAGKEKTTAYKAGETVYAKATVANNPGKVKVNISLADPKGATIKGSEVSLDIDRDGWASYSMPIPEGAPEGSYKLTADMVNEAGEKKDSKSETITIAE